MALAQSFKLLSGHEIPAVGLGTWQSKPNEVKNAVEHALKSGYRHIDAAAVYDNEKEVGEGVKASGVPRKDIFITSKLWNTHHKAEDIHWPVSFNKKDDATRFPLHPVTEAVDVIDVPVEETWKALEALVKKGKIRTIGVSNFTKEKIEALWETAEIKPAVNQIEAHPYLQQPDLLAWSKEKVSDREMGRTDGRTEALYLLLPPPPPPPLPPPPRREISGVAFRTPQSANLEWA
ncbi:aldo/keto reductase [Colletotrichum higginsianum]|nr:aldo/keto reductase [Colletotrichum higginsianum]